MTECNKHALYDKIGAEQDKVRGLQMVFLRKYGWKYTCEYPDCCWRWSKHINGDTIAATLDDALQMEIGI